jgi:hypothetical protein
VNQWEVEGSQEKKSKENAERGEWKEERSKH